MKKIYFCYLNLIDENNNFKKSGIIDAYTKINKLFGSFFELIETREIIPNQVNIIIEDFRLHNVDQINSVKKKFPKTKIILVLSEFFTENMTLNTFHLNKDNKYFYKLLYDNFKTYITYKNIALRILRYFPKFFNLLLTYNIAILFLPEILLARLKVNISILNIFILVLSCIHIIKPFKLLIELIKKRSHLDLNYLYSLKNDLHFYYRFLCLSKVDHQIDMILKTHPKIKTGMLDKIKNFNLNFCPERKIEIEKNFDLYDRILSFSGECSIYRKSFFQENIFETKLNLKDNIKNKLKRDIDHLLNLENKFIDKETIVEKTLFDLHPKKTAEWVYSSPTRYYRSINNNTIPITFKIENINDEITNKLSIEVENFGDFLESFFKNPEEKISNFNKNIESYNYECDQYNKNIINEVNNLL